LTRGAPHLALLALLVAWPCAAADYPERVLALVNAARAEPRRCGWKRFAAAPPLARSALLDRVARAHADDMAARGRMDHVGRDGSKVPERVSRAGYDWGKVAENIAAGQSTPEAAVASWLASAPHCANLMDPAYTESGAGFAPSASGGPYWAQVFATPMA
jgi:uncharacterized protein YkwD